MPMHFSNDNVLDELEMRGLSTDGDNQQKRETLAKHFEDEYGDKVAAMEVRTGVPWDQITASEAAAAIEKNPDLMLNPGMLSRLHSDK